jgi:LPS export ABC transporter protein LptC
MLMLHSCQNEIAEIRAITDANNLPVQTSLKAEYNFSEKGKLKNKLIASQIDQYRGEENYIEASGGFIMVFFDSLEKEQARLSAQKGKYTEKEKRMKAWGNVVLMNINGEKVETEELIFKQDSNRIYTDKYVTITSKQGILHGNGMESNDTFTKYRIIKPIGDFLLDQKNDSISNGESK